MRLIWLGVQRLYNLTAAVRPWSLRWLVRAMLAAFIAGLLALAWAGTLIALATGAGASLLMKRGLKGTALATGLVVVATVALMVAGLGHLAACGPPVGWVLGLADRRGIAVGRKPSAPTSTR